MDQLRVALTGTHGTGKSWIVENVKRELESRGYTVGIIPSPTREVKALGYPNNEDGTWETQLLSGVLRVKKQRELMRNAHVGYDVILADRCLNDELAYDLSMIQRWKREKAEDDPNLQALKATHFSLGRLFNDDLHNYWHQIFLKPVHPDFVPEEDGDRSGSAEYQAEVQNFAAMNLAMFASDYGVLPQDRGEAAELLLQYVLENKTK